MPSRQRVYGGGKFKSERQRRAMWANAPKAARAWAHNRRTRPSQWRGMHGGVRSVGRVSTKGLSGLKPRVTRSTAGRGRSMSTKRSGSATRSAGRISAGGKSFTRRGPRA